MEAKARELILALICAFLGSVKGLLVSLVKSLGAIQIFGLRSVGSVCFILPIIVFFNYQIRYDLKYNILLLLRSVVGNIAVCGYYFGFVYLPIAEASLLFYSTPVFTVIIGCLFLDEKCGVLEGISVVLSLAGVALVCIPDFTLEYSDSTLKGVIGSLVGAIAQALALAIVRKITFVPPAVVSFWWAVIGVVFSFVLTASTSTSTSTSTSILKDQQYQQFFDCEGYERIFIVLIALVGFVSELCLVSALKSTDAVAVSVVLTSEILWAFVFQVCVSEEMPSLMCVTGGLAIVVSICVQPVVKCCKMIGKQKDIPTLPCAIGKQRHVKDVGQVADDR